MTLENKLWREFVKRGGFQTQKAQVRSTEYYLKRCFDLNDDNNMKYWVLIMDPGDDGVMLSALPEGIDEYKYNKGVSLLERHPKNQDSGMDYDPGFPENIKLYDFVENLDGVLIGGARVREVLSALQVDNIEYLPIWLMDHKYKVSSKDYTIINLLGSVNIIDMNKSELTMCSIIKDQVDYIENLVVDYEAIPENAKIFRATAKLNQYFIRDDVKEAFEKAGLTGYKLFPSDNWDGDDD